MENHYSIIYSQKFIRIYSKWKGKSCYKNNDVYNEFIRIKTLSRVQKNIQRTLYFYIRTSVNVLILLIIKARTGWEWLRERIIYISGVAVRKRERERKSYLIITIIKEYKRDIFHTIYLFIFFFSFFFFNLNVRTFVLVESTSRRRNW